MQAARVVDQIAGSLGVARPTVFVSGFWRSGTTWMQELLAGSLRAKTVFEPIGPSNPIWLRHLIAAGVLDADSQEAYIPGQRPADDPMWRYLDLAFTGVASSPMSVRCRGSVREAFRRDIVVKDVRLQLNLAAVHQRYGVPVVHLRRHPCAVVSSLIEANWAWSFARVRLGGLTAPFSDDLRRAGMADEDWLARFDADMVSRVAAFWAITERLADRAVRNQTWATIVAYEQAVGDPDGAVGNLCRLIGRRPLPIGNAERDSASTQAASRGIPAKQRPHAWRSRLASSDIDRIYRAVGAIFPEALSDLPEERGLVSA